MGSSQEWTSASSSETTLTPRTLKEERKNPVGNMNAGKGATGAALSAAATLDGERASSGPSTSLAPTAHNPNYSDSTATTSPKTDILKAEPLKSWTKAVPAASEATMARAHEDGMRSATSSGRTTPDSWEDRLSPPRQAAPPPDSSTLVEFALPPPSNPWPPAKAHQANTLWGGGWTQF